MNNICANKIPLATPANGEGVLATKSFEKNKIKTNTQYQASLLIGPLPASSDQGRISRPLTHRREAAGIRVLRPGGRRQRRAPNPGEEQPTPAST